MSANDDAASATHAVEVSDGARGTAVAYAAERIELVLDRAYPPGRPLTFSVTLPTGPLPLQGKAQGSKRRDDASFSVQVKLTSLRREQRATLEQAFGSR
jgi:hypothetical protein